LSYLFPKLLVPFFNGIKTVFYTLQKEKLILNFEPDQENHTKAILQTKFKSMAKKMVKISAASFARLNAKLRAFETENAPIKIGKKNLSSFLIENAEAELEEDAEDPKPIRTKRIILHIAGDYTTSPNDLRGSLRLRLNLGYGDDEYALLQTRLDKLVKQYKSSASISATETNDCEKVSDCVKLVEEKTSDNPPA
jgi:hypothetical protein